VITGGDCATGHDIATGKELWRANGLNPDNSRTYRIVASPIIFNDIIYAPTRVKPLLALKAGGRGDITTSHLLWSTPNGPDVPTPVTDGKYFYIVNDRGIMWCLDARTGAEIYGQQRIKPAIYSGSPVLADGKIYVTNEEGLTTVIQAGPEFKVLAENRAAPVCDRTEVTRIGVKYVALAGFDRFARDRCKWAVAARTCRIPNLRLASGASALPARARRASLVLVRRGAGGVSRVNQSRS
jgi:hypothetical protein